MRDTRLAIHQLQKDLTRLYFKIARCVLQCWRDAPMVCITVGIGRYLCSEAVGGAYLCSRLFFIFDFPIFKLFPLRKKKHEIWTADEQDASPWIQQPSVGQAEPHNNGYVRIYGYCGSYAEHKRTRRRTQTHADADADADAHPRARHCFF